MRRLVTALVAVPVLLVIILAGGPWALLALVTVVALAGYWELGSVLERVGLRPLAVGYFAVALLLTSFHPGLIDFEKAGLALIPLIGLAAVISRAPGRDTLAEVGLTLLGTLYLGALGGSVVALRSSPEGEHWVVFLLAVVLIGDAGAFYVGRSWGRRPLAPRLSPKKTVEGLFGGLASSLATALVLGRVLFPFLSMAWTAGLGLALALLGVAGDLFESLVKRSVGVKDTSELFPGHGGVLDRIDSVLFAAPALLFYVRWTQT